MPVFTDANAVHPRALRRSNSSYMTAPGSSVPQALRPGDPVAIITMNQPRRCFLQSYICEPRGQETLSIMLNKVRTVISAQAPSTVP